MQQGLVLKSTAAGDSMIRVTYDRSTSTVTIATLTDGAATPVGTHPRRVSFANGNTFGAQVVGNTRDGLPERHLDRVRLDRGMGGDRAPQIGVWFAGTTNAAAGNARIDNFGGGTLREPPTDRQRRNRRDRYRHDCQRQGRHAR